MTAPSEEAVRAAKEAKRAAAEAICRWIVLDSSGGQITKEYLTHLVSENWTRWLLAADDALAAAYAVDRAEIVAEVGCEDCGRPYGDHGFPDLIIPLSVWRRISTHGDETGLLCPSCICARLGKAGISCVEGAFMSGPIEPVSRATMYALRGVENLELRLDREATPSRPPAQPEGEHIVEARERARREGRLAPLGSDWS